MNLTIAIVFLLFTLSFVSGRYLGGTVKWYCQSCINGRNLIRFTYRLVWEKGTGPCGQSCSPNDVQKKGVVPASLQGLNWKCTSGCGNMIVLHPDVNYVMTSISYNDSGWEQGEFSFRTTSLKGNGPFEVTLDGIPWKVPTVVHNGTGRLVTKLEVGKRNDSNLANASPLAAVQATIGIQFGCTVEIPFAVEDPDADTLRCRLATKRECGDACTNLPKVKINRETCTMSIAAKSSSGYVADRDYRLTIMVEDYPDYTISMGTEIRSIRRPMSKIPLQLTIRTITDNKECTYERGTFSGVYPNHHDYFRFSYSPGGNITQVESRMFLMANDVNNTDIMLSVPEGMSSVRLPDNPQNTGIPYRRNVVQQYFTMQPKNPLQIADALFCAWARSPNGITNGQLCYAGILFDINDCQQTNQCKHNGTCMDLYGRFTCKCPHGYKPLDCSHKVTCADFPCKNNGTCVDTGTMYICVCPKGYTGLDCENLSHIVVDNSNSNILPILLGVFGGMAVLATTATCCCWWCAAAAKKSKEKKKKQPIKTPNVGLDTL